MFTFIICHWIGQKWPKMINKYMGILVLLFNTSLCVPCTRIRLQLLLPKSFIPSRHSCTNNLYHIINGDSKSSPDEDKTTPKVSKSMSLATLDRVKNKFSP